LTEHPRNGNLKNRKHKPHNRSCNPQIGLATTRWQHIEVAVQAKERARCHRRRRVPTAPYALFALAGTLSTEEIMVTAQSVELLSPDEKC
jgi:hypothetical protein